VSFFDPLPPEPAEPDENQETGWRPPVWDRPSEGTLGVTVGITMVLGRTDDLALAVDHFSAYANGFSFDLVIMTTPHRRVDPRTFHMPVMRASVPRLGFEFSDGTRTSGGGVGPFLHPGAGFEKDELGVPKSAVLMTGGGGGAQGRWAMRQWCFPLPPPGDVKLHYEWERRGIPEGVVTLDADVIREAAARAIVLWE
jgi:hypothetical protein